MNSLEKTIQEIFNMRIDNVNLQVPVRFPKRDKRHCCGHTIRTEADRRWHNEHYHPGPGIFPYRP